MHKYSTTEELMHYGVKGMKWGVRRYQNKDGTLTSAGKKASDKKRALVKKQKPEVSKEDLVKSTNAKTLYKNKDRLTDAEMRDRINRIQMEQNLYKLSKTQPSVSNSGRKMASSIAGRFGNAVLNAVVQESVNYAMPTIKKTIRR